ncbi:MAG: hypothetical protein RIR43_340 [Pseudomonadota bacterium]|jgi:hypothetical protein
MARFSAKVLALVDFPTCAVRLLTAIPVDASNTVRPNASGMIGPLQGLSSDR